MRHLPSVAAIACATALCAACSGSDGGARTDPDDGPPTVLFVRGADGTGGALAGGDDLHLSDIDSDAAQGFASLAALLEDDGFEVSQVVEGDGGADLSTDALAEVDVLVLGSNNAAYDQATVDAVTGFVRAGGGLLAFSDANYGSDYAAAPDSDNQFLAPFGLRLAHDSGGDPSATTSERFATADHPLLEGVSSYEWHGPSAVVVVGDDPRVTPEVLVGAERDVLVDGDADPQVTEAAGPNDAEIAVLEYGAGRVVAIYDRDIFFSPGGAVSVESADNATLTTNLFEWLAGQR